ncbi:MAG: carbohydrate kinase family protein, partial [Candidatus Jordarchaeum sp.]|uniref:carbohydrate kinase family protein n=1 Tax=Candidatus Jordarchaeum sp. TaxID=2823881 RepID=UPI0040495181
MVKIVSMGAINYDINLFVERFPKIGEEVPVKQITRIPGGKGANVAVAAARLMNPGEVAFIGGLGDDQIAERQKEVLKSEGVNTSGIITVKGVESGQAYIVIDSKGENFINTLFGANHEIKPEDIEEKSRLALIREAKVLAIVDPPLPVILRVMELGKKCGTINIWDPGIHCVKGYDSLKNILKFVDILLMNAVEVENLTGVSEPQEVKKRLSPINKTLTVVKKMGAEGSQLIEPGDKQSTLIKGIPLLKYGFKVLNTVGCGDSFHGVLAASLAEGYSLFEALQRANLAGAFKATRSETRGSPTRKELAEFSKK